jgi:hypothetical protein
MKGNKFAFALLLGSVILLMLLYSCSLPLPIVHGKKKVVSDEEEEEEEEDV